MQALLSKRASKLRSKLASKLAVVVGGWIAIACAPGFMAAAEASEIVAKVNLSQQRMEVSVDGVTRHSWRVSTGRDGYNTQAGVYQPFALTPHYFSKKWNMSLPYLISIDDKGTAIHGTTQTGNLGRVASHGCIRLDTANAAILYKLIESNGLYSSKIIVVR
jgi:lipoprotein-anchoring transpeptidase ErfK/SrfK